MTRNKVIMNFLEYLHSNKNPKRELKINYKTIERIEDLDIIIKTSFHKSIVIFKHSTRCSVSRMCWNRFQKEFRITEDKMELFLLDLLNFRSISNEIEKLFEVIHQSPQIIVIRNGKAIFNISHEGIDANKMEDFL